MKKLIILSLLCIVSLSAMAQVSQETYQAARKKNKELKAQLDSLNKAYSAEMDRLKKQCDVASNGKSAMSIKGLEDAKTQLKAEKARLDKEIGKNKKKADDLDKRRLSTQKDAAEGETVEKDRKDLLLKVPEYAVTYPLRAQYSDKSIKMTSEDRLNEIFNGNGAVMRQYRKHSTFLQHYSEYNEEILSIFTACKQELDSNEKRMERELSGENLTDKYIEILGNSKYISKTKDDFNIPYLEDAICEFELILDMEPELASKFLGKLIARLQPKE